MLKGQSQELWTNIEKLAVFAAAIALRCCKVWSAEDCVESARKIAQLVDRNT